MSITERELPLSSAGHVARLCATTICAAMMADSPVAAIDSRSLWQRHSSSQRHGSEEQEHGHIPLDGSDGGAVKTPFEL